jgi:hypothetical protein
MFMGLLSTSIHVRCIGVQPRRILLYISAAKYQIGQKELDEKINRSYNYKWVPRDPESGKKLSAKAMGSEQPGGSRRATIRKENREEPAEDRHI